MKPSTDYVKLIVSLSEGTLTRTGYETKHTGRVNCETIVVIVSLLFLYADVRIYIRKFKSLKVSCNFKTDSPSVPLKPGGPSAPDDKTKGDLMKETCWTPINKHEGIKCSV